MNQREIQEYSEMYGFMEAPANMRFVPECEVHAEKYRKILEKPEDWAIPYVLEVREKLALIEAGNPAPRDVWEEEAEYSVSRRINREINFALALGWENVYGNRHDHPGGISGISPTFGQ